MFRRDSHFPVLSVAARGMLQAAKRVRHSLRPIRRGGRIARHLVSYRVPGEVRACPACASPRIVAIEPLSSARPRCRFGFISGCRRCGLLFANPLPSEADLDTVYSPEGEWGRHRQEEYEKQVSRARLAALFAPIAGELDVLSPPDDAAVLDFGCGLGGMLDAFAAAGWRTFGIDPATKAAFDRHQELGGIPAAPMCDLAVLHQVLEHVANPSSILRGLARAVRPGGYVLIGVPNLEALERHGDLKYCIRSTVHVLAYTTESLTWLLADAGFRTVSSAPAPGGDKRRVVLARREDGPLPRPRHPLGSAIGALAGYRRAHETASALMRLVPVRVRAAYADLERAEWRL